jgi:hypothetical protein
MRDACATGRSNYLWPSTRHWPPSPKSLSHIAIMPLRRFTLIIWVSLSLTPEYWPPIKNEQTMAVTHKTAIIQGFIASPRENMIAL